MNLKKDIVHLIALIMSDLRLNKILIKFLNLLHNKL